jgi:hypothetical protein
VKIISLYAGDVSTDNAEEPQELTPMQLARRRQMAIVLCSNAANRTSHLMAQRICKSWFKECDKCPYREVNEN